MQPQIKAPLVDVPIRPTLTRLALQMMVGIMGMIAFNLVDTFFIGRDIASMFNTDMEVLDVATRYLSIVPLAYGFIGVLMLSNTCLNALNRPLYAATLTSVQMLVLYVPLAHLGESAYGLSGIFFAAVAASVAAGAAAYIWLLCSMG